VRFQLRVYSVAPGALDALVGDWEEHVRPLRLAQGFSVLGPWVGDDGETFVYVLGHDGDFEAAEAGYAASLGRAGLDGDPAARHVVARRLTFMQSPWRARARGR
jgi:hypothetical protein